MRDRARALRGSRGRIVDPFEELIFDVSRGELLQTQSVVIENTDSSRPVPRLQRVRSSSGIVVRVDMGLRRNGTSIQYGGHLYWVRGRTSDIVPDTPICAIRPKVCRDSGGPMTDPSGIVNVTSS